jgi:hypothetical protein
VLGDPVDLIDPTGEFWIVVEVVSIAVTAYAIWKWFDNMIDNKKERERKDYFCSKIKDPIKRAYCYDKNRKEHLKKEINNSCDLGKELTPDIKTLRY